MILIWNPSDNLSLALVDILTNYEAGIQRPCHLGGTKVRHMLHLRLAHVTPPGVTSKNPTTLNTIYVYMYIVIGNAWYFLSSLSGSSQRFDIELWI